MNTATEVERTRRQKTGPPPRVLLAEDDAEMRRLLELLLLHSGFDVDLCANGVELLRRLEETRVRAGRDRRERCDLVISDIYMPGASGIEALRVITALPDPPPVILITAFGDGATVEASFDAGANAVLDKPFDPAFLIMKARELTQRLRA